MAVKPNFVLSVWGLCEFVYRNGASAKERADAGEAAREILRLRPAGPVSLVKSA